MYPLYYIMIKQGTLSKDFMKGQSGCNTTTIQTQKTSTKINKWKEYKATLELAVTSSIIKLNVY